MFSDLSSLAPIFSFFNDIVSRCYVRRNHGLGSLRRKLNTLAGTNVIRVTHSFMRWLIWFNKSLLVYSSLIHIHILILLRFRFRFRFLPYKFTKFMNNEATVDECPYIFFSMRLVMLSAKSILNPQAHTPLKRPDLGLQVRF